MIGMYACARQSCGKRQSIVETEGRLFVFLKIIWKAQVGHVEYINSVHRLLKVSRFNEILKQCQTSF